MNCTSVHCALERLEERYSAPVAAAFFFSSASRRIRAGCAKLCRICVS